MGHTSKGQRGRISTAELSFYREMANVRAGVSSSVSLALSTDLSTGHLFRETPADMKQLPQSNES